MTAKAIAHWLQDQVTGKEEDWVNMLFKEVICWVMVNRKPIY